MNDISIPSTITSTTTSSWWRLPNYSGDLRAALHPEVTQRILAEIPKDLTAHSLPELRDLLSLDTGTRQ